MSRYSHIYETIDKIKPKTILEVGTWNGVQAARMIEACKQYHEDVFYYGFDVFDAINKELRDKELHTKAGTSFFSVVERLNETGVGYELIKGNTVDTLPTFIPKRNIDLFYIDGGHSLETIKSDFTAASKICLEQGRGTILLDDYYHNITEFGCKPLVEELRATSSSKVRIFDTIDALTAPKTNRYLEISMVEVVYD